MKCSRCGIVIIGSNQFKWGYLCNPCFKAWVKFLGYNNVPNSEVNKFLPATKKLWDRFIIQYKEKVMFS